MGKKTTLLPLSPQDVNKDRNIIKKKKKKKKRDKLSSMCYLPTKRVFQSKMCTGTLPSLPKPREKN